MYSIGLDFGTTNTRLAFSGTPWQNSDTGEGLIPSAVAFLPNREIVVGADAKERVPIDPANVVLGPKRLLGCGFYSRMARHYDATHAVTLVENEGNVAIATRDGVKTPETLCSLILSKIVAAADVKPKRSELAVTVPVAFEKKQRRALVGICRGLGVSRVSLLNEPVATAVAYWGRSNVQRGAVFDMGGGTFDFAIIGPGEGMQGIRVFASGGDDALGGNDVDAALASWAASEVLVKTGWDLESDKMVYGRLLAAAERAKLALWRQETVALDLVGVDEAAPVGLPKLTITRGFLMELAFPFIQRAFRICDEVLSSAKMKAEEMDAVFMAGGGTLMHGVSSAVSRYFGKPARTDIPPAYVVSIGAGLALARPSLNYLLETHPG